MVGNLFYASKSGTYRLHIKLLFTISLVDFAYAFTSMSIYSRETVPKIREKKLIQDQ